MLGVPLWLRRRTLNNSSIAPAQPFPGRSRGVNRGEPAPAAAKTTTEPLPPGGKAVAVQLRGTFTPAELDALTQSLTPAQKAAFQTQFAAAKKERGTAIALSVIPVVGNFGIGRFYLGQTGLGILHIVLMLAFIIPGIIFWIIDWFVIGRACDHYNREKAREIAVLIKSLG
ncbi:MAG: NINE protein [Limisphaerales bacterium]